jgi:hypothetical protein
MQVSRDAVWGSLSELDRRRILRRSAEVREVVDGKLDQWRGWIGPLDHAEPGLPERLVERLKRAYVAQELHQDRLDAARRVGEPFWTGCREASAFVQRELNAVSLELFEPPEFAEILDGGSFERRLAAAGRLVDRCRFGDPVFPLARRRLSYRGLRPHVERVLVEGQLKLAEATDHRKNIRDAERIWARDNKLVWESRDSAGVLVAAPGRDRARAEAMLLAVVNLREPDSDPSAAYVTLECAEPFQPLGRTFWPILKRWLRNQYRREYLALLHVEPRDIPELAVPEGDLFLEADRTDQAPSLAEFIDDEDEAPFNGLKLSDGQREVVEIAMAFDLTLTKAAKVAGFNESYGRGVARRIKSQVRKGGGPTHPAL